ncbi:MAG: hypothetical protein JST49_03535 [Bacteroidetes bacterium]|nr:hypothetical protein [Bacteroidota bacterium]
MGRMSQLCVLLALMLVGGCSLDAKVREAKRVMGEGVARDSKGGISLVSLEKVNGFEKDLDGTPGYVMDFKAVIRYDQDAVKLKFRDRTIWDGIRGYYDDFYVHPYPEDGSDTYAEGEALYYHKGDKVELYGTMTFAKTDNGWKLGDLKIARYVDDLQQ